MKRAVIFFVLKWMVLLGLSAQTEELPVLLEKLKQLPDSEQKVDVLVQIGDRLLLTNAKAAQDYGEQALKITKKLSYPAGRAKAQIIVGKAYLQQNRLRRGVDNLEEAVPWAEQQGEAPVLSDLYGLLINAYKSLKRSKEEALYQEKYDNLNQRKELQSNQQKFEQLETQFLEQKDSVSLERLNTLRAQAMTDSALQLVNARDLALSQQSLELANLEKEAAKFQQEKAESELRLQLERQKRAEQQQQFYWVLAGFVFVLVLGLSAWFYYQSRQARKLAKIERLEAERLRILTAGIAHEIKNPLNFVNNFAEGSVEISDELTDVLIENRTKIQPEQYALLADLVGELKQNSVDIRKNGQRVHQIVQSMTDYASGGKGERKPTNLNQLLDENINLAYHGYRAQHPHFIANIERKYDASLTAVEVIPQEIGRVFLNLVNNACYALQQKQKNVGSTFTPTLTVSTIAQNGEAIVRIRDNGTGIPPEVRDKIFTPFFTTKPTGAGNAGLGLSISNEIITQHHHGKLELQTQANEFTEFIIRLPKNHSL